MQEALEGSEDLEVAHEEVSEAEVVVHPELDPQMPQEEPLSEQPGEYAFCQPLENDLTNYNVQGKLLPHNVRLVYMLTEAPSNCSQRGLN